MTWGWFQEGFWPTHAATATDPAVCGAAHASSLVPSTADYIPHHEPFQYDAQTANPHHLRPTSIAKIGQTDRANHQYDLQDFFDALDAGHLPAVSYLKAAAYQDGHAGYSDTLDEQEFLVNTINRLMQHHRNGPIPPSWCFTTTPMAGTTMSWDPSSTHRVHRTMESLFGPGNCGSAPAGSFQGRCGYGPRQPLLVISPWARRNSVDHGLTDQASILRFIEDNWGLERLGDQIRRRHRRFALEDVRLQRGSPTYAHLAVILNPLSGTP